MSIVQNKDEPLGVRSAVTTIEMEGGQMCTGSVTFNGAMKFYKAPLSNSVDFG